MGIKQRFSGRGNRQRATLACAWLFALTSLARGQEEDLEVRSFALPDTRAVRALVAAVEDHLAAERAQEASMLLQELLMEHSRALLPGRLDEVHGHRSQQPVHEGVGPWATARLFSLPPGPQEKYRLRYENMAAVKLERALLTADREALAGVGTLWPLTRSAERAWWILGDLSLERGQLDEARHAWRRGAAWALSDPDLVLETPRDWRDLAAQLSERSDSSAVTARLELAASSLESTLSYDAATLRPPHGEMRLPGEGERRVGPPAGEGSAWSEPFSLPDHPFGSSYNNFYAARSGDRVVVCNSMRAVCVQAFSGELLWDSGEAPGWEELNSSERDDFHKAIDLPGALMAPALTDQIAVCALEIPFAVFENQDFNHIPILRRIPDRRLFAFDLITGEELWSHLPPKDWDGESGTFPECSRVAGPAVIAGGRVLVPAYRLEGRIALHVACYDLTSGALIWNTQVISGQRELNMFNRHQREFSAPPLRVEGDRVLALTQLGAVACLDLFSGQPLWETLYDQVAIPQRGQFTSRRRESTWSNTPPVVGDGVVVCTPIDSRDMIGLDLESGAMIWSLGLRDIEALADTPRTRLEHLIGCDKSTVFLSGQCVIALEAPVGLSSGAPSRILWRATDDSLEDSSHPPRALLLEDRVVIPTHTHRVDVDRHQGFRLASPTRWSGGRPGNLLVCPDAIFTLDNYELTGYFEWESLLESARVTLLADPTDLDNAFLLADLLREYARSELTVNRSGIARALLDEAEVLLRARVEDPTRSEDARTRLHGVLVTRARTLESLDDLRGALAAWGEASDLAPTPEARLESLLEEHRLLEGHDADARLATLVEIEQDCAGLTVFCEEVDENVSHLNPVPQPIDPEETPIWAVEASIWVAWARVDQHAARGETSLELKELYRLVDLGGSDPLPGGPPRDVALHRLDQVLAEPGARQLLEPYEESARALLAEVGTLGPASVQTVLRRYPRTAAAAHAADQLLEEAIRIGDVPTAARLVLELLPESFALGTGDPLHSSRVVALALALRTTGNDAYLRACLRRLSVTGSSDAPFLSYAYSEDLGELASKMLSKTQPVAINDSSFSPRARRVWWTPSGVDVDILGELPPSHEGPTHPERILLVGTRDTNSASGSGELIAFGGSNPGQPLWRRPLSGDVVSIGWQEELRVFGAGYVVMGSGQALESVNRSDGFTRWRWRPTEGVIRSLDSVEGLILVTCRLPSRSYRIQALDEVRGEPLWSFEYDWRSYHQSSVCGESWVVLLPSGRSKDAIVLDAFTGRVANTVYLGESLLSRVAEGSWISEGKLVIPHLTDRRKSNAAEVSVVDLSRSDAPWTVSVSLPDGGESYLETVLRHEGRTWLIVRPHGNEEDRKACVFELHVGVGAAARIHGLTLGVNELLVGAKRGGTHVIDTQEVYVRTEEQGGAVHRLRAHDLLTGARLWAWRLGSNRDLYNRRWPRPTTSSNAVALVFTEKAQGPEKRTNLVFLDPRSGQQIDSMILPTKLYGFSDQVRMEGLGDALLISGTQMMEVLR